MTHATKPARLPAAQRPQLARMPALIISVYPVAACLLFVVVLGYAAGFLAGFGVRTGTGQGPRADAPVAVAIVLLLLLLCAVRLICAVRPRPSVCGRPIHPRRGGFR